MRSVFSVLLCALTVSFGLGALAKPAVGTCSAELCDGNSLDVVSRSLGPSPTVQRKDLSNAERLAQGLPIKPPTRRTDIVPRKHLLASPVPKVNYHGIMRLVEISTGDIMGYVANTELSVGILSFTPVISEALQISFDINVGATSGTNLAFTMLNGPPSGPPLGLVQGRDNTNTDLAVGSYHYLYFAGVSPPVTQPDAYPANIPNGYTSATGTVRAAESSVWSVDLVSGAITGEWTNSNLAQPPISFWSQGVALYAGSDSNAFFSRYPSRIRPFRLEFVSTV
ncbi:hypothetical protein B0H34DRAFT_677087 [Crassisporium funariophilum]|nr:hypothetical protein B0H34DRAFT_677087 [Crassisporium funariophilum]